MAELEQVQEYTVATRVVAGCRCGCGEFPSTPGNLWCMGHDARHRGALVKAYLAGHKIRYLIGDETEELTAMEAAERSGDSFVKALLDGQRRAQEVGEARAKKEAAREAVKVEKEKQDKERAAKKPAKASGGRKRQGAQQITRKDPAKVKADAEAAKQKRARRSRKQPVAA